MLCIYYADVSGLPDQGGELPLSSYRLAKRSSCRLPRNRRQGLGAELLLIHALRERDPAFPLPLSIETGPEGKPCLRGEALSFSLTHSGETAACALCDGPVGIDLEAERPLQESVLRRCFSQREQRLVLEAQRPAAAFARLWTQKESYLKATGEGLRSLGGIDLLSPPEDAFFYHTQQAGLHLSVCVLGRPALPDRIEEVALSRAFLNNLMQD